MMQAESDHVTPTTNGAFDPIDPASKEALHSADSALNPHGLYEEEDTMIMEVDLEEQGSGLSTGLLDKLNSVTNNMGGISNNDGQTQATAPMTSYLSSRPNWEDSWSSDAVNANYINEQTLKNRNKEAIMFWHRNSNLNNVRIALPDGRSVLPQVDILDDTPMATNINATGYPNYPDNDNNLQPYDMAWTRHPTSEMTWTRNRINPPARRFEDSYTILNHGQPIGEGGFGMVYSCTSNKSQRRRAVKILPAQHYDRNEVEILQSLKDGPHIVTLKDLFFGLDQVYLVMEEMKGDLLSSLQEKVYYEESEARTVVHTLLDTVAYMHAHGIAHRDLKPENILMGPTSKDIKLADFGLAKRFRDADGNRLDPNMFTLCGSVWYAAPEVFGRNGCSEPYDERCDLWSIGILTYLLLAGYMPFLTEANTNSDYQVVQQVKRGNYQFHGEYWGNISLAAKQLISSLLKVHPVQRCTVREALDSPWIVLPITAHFREGQNSNSSGGSSQRNNTNVMLV